MVSLRTVLRRTGSADKITSMRPVLLGHRGSRCSRSVAENTCAAFDSALQHGCDGFEFDVRLTADGVAVICHDPHIAKSRAIKISAATASQVTNLPRLEMVLERYGDRAFLDIELKVPGLETSVLELLRERPPERGFVVSSFLPQVLLDLKRRSPAVPAGLICGNRRQLQLWRELPAEYVIVRQSLSTYELLNEVQGAGKKLFVWTVNHKSAMLRLAEWAVDGIISDRTDLLGKALA